MNPAKLFPNASDSFLRLNPNLRPDGQAPGAKLEPSAGHGPLAAIQAEAGDTAQFLVRVTSFRVRLCDEDNLAVKWFVDCVRYAGAIPDDAPEIAHIEARQFRVKTAAEERTLIEVFAITHAFPVGNA